MSHNLLPYLGAAARDARKQHGRLQVHIAAEIGVGEATVRKFEQGKHWPRNPDAMIAAYAKDLGIEPCELWEEALKRCCQPSEQTRRRR